MLAEENIEGYLRLPKTFLSGSPKHFLLRVHGNSMNQAIVDGGSIQDGDIVLVRQQPIADRGDIVVALIDDEGDDQATGGRTGLSLPEAGINGKTRDHCA